MACQRTKKSHRKACVFILLIAVAIEKENGFVVRDLIIFHNSDVLLVVSLNSLEGNHSLIPTIAEIFATPTFIIFVENGELFSIATVIFCWAIP